LREDRSIGFERITVAGGGAMELAQLEKIMFDF